MGYRFQGQGHLDARTLFHYTAIVVTPAMEAEMVGIGSQYLTIGPRAPKGKEKNWVETVPG